MATPAGKKHSRSNTDTTGTNVCVVDGCDCAILSNTIISYDKIKDEDTRKIFFGN